MKKLNNLIRMLSLRLDLGTVKKILKLVLFKDVQNERLFFYPILKGSELMKTENQESKGRSPPFKTTKQKGFLQP